MTIEQELKKLSLNIEKLSLPAAKYVVNPCPIDAIVASLDGVGIIKAPSIVELYSNFGGFNIVEGALSEEFWIYSSFCLDTLENSLLNYKCLIDSAEWHVGNFPLFSNGGGDFYSIVTSLESKFFGYISYFMLGEEEYIAYSSLENFLSVINKCYDQGICYSDAGGYLETDHLKALLVAADMNSNLTRYQ